MSAFREAALTPLIHNTHDSLKNLFTAVHCLDKFDAVQASQPDTILNAAVHALKDVKLETFYDATMNATGIFQTRLRFDLSAEALSSLADEVIERSKEIEDNVAKVAPGKHSFENVLKPLIEQERILSSITSTVDFMSHVHVDKSIRDTSTEADKKMNQYFVESGMRTDVFAAVQAYHKKGDKLDAEHQRVLDFLIRDFKRNGLENNTSTRERITQIKKEISSLSIEFQKNLGEENTTLKFTRDELEGMPVEFLEKLPERNGVFTVSLKYPEAFPVLKLCKVSETRRIVEREFNSRCIDVNTFIIERLVSLRHELAQLLGYKDHSSYVLEIRMAKSPDKVKQFLTDLSERLEPLVNQELDALLTLKKNECEHRSEEFDERINMWDFRYYLNLREQMEYNIDHEQIKKYFPIHIVTKGLFHIYQELLCLRFDAVEQAHTWHSDVQMFSVTDTRTNELVGYFYLDLHPRNGKYGHAAVFGLQAQCEGQLPTAAMVANFTKPSENKPSLLQHQEVVTYFHEFGHVMHQLCSKVKTARFSGTRVQRDFVECPSQMLENWCWEKDTLMMMSGHVEDETKKLPVEIVERLMKTKNANAGLLNRRQILFGLLDQTIHSQAEATTAELLSDLQQKIMRIPMTPGTNFAASFGHLAGGYDASYYGYMWSEVFSMDMFETRFKAEGLLNPKVGLDYRNIILARGGSIDADKLLQEFLGRQPSQQAFLRSKIGVVA